MVKPQYLAKGMHMKNIMPELGAEILYSVIVLILCIIIYYKTKELYDLTKHKGILYFRRIFVYFSLAYVFRFLTTVFLLSGIESHLMRTYKTVVYPLSLVFVGYLSTMALFSLMLSTSWKIFEHQKHGDRFLFLWTNLISAGIALLVFYTKSVDILLSFQLVLFLFTIGISLKNHRKLKSSNKSSKKKIKSKKSKKTSKMFSIYLLLMAFWLLNLSMVVPGRFFGFIGKSATYTISVIIFLTIYYKVHKWTK